MIYAPPQVAKDFTEHVLKSRTKPRRRASAARAPRPPKGTRLPSRRSDRNEVPSLPLA